MQDLIKKASTPELRERCAFAARRNSHYTQLQSTGTQLAEHMLEETVDELCELLGLPETLIKSGKAQGGAR